MKLILRRDKSKVALLTLGAVALIGLVDTAPALANECDGTVDFFCESGDEGDCALEWGTRDRPACLLEDFGGYCYVYYETSTGGGCA